MDYSKLLNLAFDARKNSYSPYSHFMVGAAILTEDGTVYTGCNIESCAYSPSNCAERTALFKAVSEGHRSFRAIAVVGGPESEGENLSQIAYPCGICRQMLYEFSDGSLEIIMGTNREAYTTTTLAELLPNAFTPMSLGSKN